MNHRFRFSCQLLFPGLALSSSLLALPAHAADAGETLATTLNTQWASSVESCIRGNDTLSALACSGVLLKTLPDTAAEHQMVAGGLLFLRHDLNPPLHLTGAVMPAGNALNPDAKGPGAACVRPVAVSTDTTRSAYGCGAVTHTPSETEDSDVSTCNQQKKGPGEADWKWDGKCSLSVEIEPEFSLAMKLNQDSKTANPGKNAMQVWYHHWPATLAGAVPQALVYTAGDSTALQARQTDQATLKTAGQNVPILKYTPASATPFSYVKSDNDANKPPVLTREAVQKKLDALFDNKKPVKFILVPPSFTRDNHTLQYPRINTDLKTVEATNPFTPGTLTYYPSYSEFKEMSLSFYNLNDNAVLYGFIVDDQGHPAASIYAPYASQSGRRAAIALAKQYNIQTNSTLPVATMNVKATTDFNSVREFISGESPFIVNFIGNEDEIQKGGKDTLEEKAQKVINRYKETSESCSGNSPAWQCSGLIIRTTDNYPFTVPQNNPVASYSYVRSDTNTAGLWAKPQGVILNPESVKNKNAVQCIYPMDADSWSDHGRDKTHYYCNYKTGPVNISMDDYSSCGNDTHVVPASGTNAGTMAHNFYNTYSKGFSRDKQCSFSVKDATQFYASILASAFNKPISAGMSWNELILIPHYTQQAMPDADAFWYQNGNEGAKKKAEKYAQDYADNRGVRVPVIGITWNQGGSSTVFTIEDN